jgi:hypothetical protein
VAKPAGFERLPQRITWHASSDLTPLRG